MNAGATQDQDNGKQWTALRKSVTTAAEEVLQNKERAHRQPWMTKEILKKMEERKKAKDQTQ